MWFDKKTLPQAWLDAARKELGKGESGGNNRGPDVNKYRFGQKYGAWCAWFLSWCLAQACKSLKLPVPIDLTGGAKKLYRRVSKHGCLHPTPETGDVACWTRGALNAPTGHVGIVSRVALPSFWTVEGNRGSYPAKVREYRHEVGEASLMGFASLNKE